jgi:hypothetical protein
MYVPLQLLCYGSSFCLQCSIIGEHSTRWRYIDAHYQRSLFDFRQLRFHNLQLKEEHDIRQSLEILQLVTNNIPLRSKEDL